MTPGTNHFSNDSESLQADVMRFMAIIAFCLIAILALVRNVEPSEEAATPPAEDEIAENLVTETPVVEPVNEPVVIEPPAPVEMTPPVVLQPAEPEPELVPQPVLIEEELAQAPMPMVPPPIVPPPVAPPPVAQTLVVPPRAQLPVEESPVEPIADTTPADDAGLILRFASDGDFLRLIARGDIKVYAFQERDVLSLDGSYRFLDTPSPGQVYELLIASIPSLIIDALKKERADIQGFSWGIALPTKISSQIEHYLEQVEHGQLVIDRYGDVHHVAAS